MKKKVLGIIPSRLESNRLVQKPLIEVLGIPLIIHVLKRAMLCKYLDDLVVATDSMIIVDLVKKNGGKAILTDKSHRNGTERMSEVLLKMPHFDAYTLINGDEILLNPESIKISISALLNNPDVDASILAVKFNRTNSASDFKMVLNSKNEVMYISRNDIPSAARNPVDFRLKAYHLMTFKPETIRAYIKMDISPLELIEGHEHLRLIEAGYKIKAEVVDDKCISLDTAEDMEVILNYLKTDSVIKQYA